METRKLSKSGSMQGHYTGKSNLKLHSLSLLTPITKLLNHSPFCKIPLPAPVDSEFRKKLRTFLQNSLVYLFKNSEMAIQTQEQPASKLSYLGERSESRENVRASGEARSSRSREARFACPNRRACSRANTRTDGSNYFVENFMKYTLFSMSDQ